MSLTDEKPAAGARLQLVLDQYAVETLPLKGARTVLGGQEGPGKVAIHHASIADNHAEITFVAGGGALLRDLGSAHGTFVNGEPISERLLVEGDLIRLGNCDTRLLLYREARRPTVVLPSIVLNRPVVTIGRAASNAVRINHPTVSAVHAEVRRLGEGFQLVDRGSTNGTWVNGTRVTRHRLQAHDRISLGAVQMLFDGNQLSRHPETSGVRLSAFGLNRTIVRPETGQKLALLNNISLCIQPREFVGLLGPAGAGKSTLMYALNGSQPADSGRVLLNESDVYSELPALRSLIGYLPQEDILHRSLTVRDCLYYAARLRLPDDFSEDDIHARVQEVIKELELTERAEVVIGQVSGGQRKRVSLAIELLSKPSLLFMDEPTAGQDPRTEMRLMQLFRQLANRGATIVCTTHLLGSFSLLDKVAVLVRGKLAYFGPSQEMLKYFHATRPTEVYDRLEQRTPDEWGKRYRESEYFRENVGEQEAGASKSRVVSPAPPEPPRQSKIRQFVTLFQRQIALRLNQWGNTAGLLVPPAAIAALVGMMKEVPNEPKVLFMVVFSALWFGCSAAVREVVDELPIYRRERGRNLSVVSYLGSKLGYLAGLAVAQSALFMLVLTLMGGQDGHFLAAWGLMSVLAFQGALIGLLISALCSSPERALYVFPLALIPQLLLAGLFVPVEKPQLLLPVDNQAEHRIEFPQLPPELLARLTPKGMAPALRYGVSSLMVGRWGFEALADVYIHDESDDAIDARIRLLNTLSITFHPDDSAHERAYLEVRNRRSQGDQSASLPENRGAAMFSYLGILAAFAAVMTAASAVALKRQDSSR